MKSILKLIFFFFLASSPVFAKSKGVKINVSLSPAGSFEITTKKIKGKLYFNEDGSFSAKNIRIPIKTLSSGIKLRDDHLHKKLGLNLDPKAVLKLIEATGSNGKGQATFLVLGKEQKTDITYRKLSKEFAGATFKLALNSFGISGISYMGVGVQNMVDVQVILPIKRK